MTGAGPLPLNVSAPREREARLRQYAGAFEDALVGMTVLGLDHKRLAVNRAFCQFVGYSAQELEGMSMRELVHPEDIDEDWRQFALLLDGAKESYRRDKRYMHKHGHAVWADFSCTLARDHQGAPLFFVTQVLDITERKGAEQQLRDMQSMLHLAAQVGRLGAWAWEVGSPTLAWSAEACAIYEVPPGFMPTPHQAVDFTVPAQRESLRATIAQCLRSGSPFDTEVEIVAARGRRLWVRVICEAEWDGSGQVRRLQGAVQDISEARAARHEILRLNAELEERVLQRTAQLESANRELEAFSYSIAHDLRGPLSSIDGFSNTLEASAGAVLDEKSLHYLRRIRAGVRQLSDLTDGLLSLAHLSRADLQPAGIDLAQLARREIDAMRRRDPHRVVHVVIPQVLPVRGDARLVSQALFHLLDNAWKFTSKRESAHIELGSKAGPDGEAIYFVRDDGVGFDMAYASKMFEAFHRIHAADDFPGVGLGLAVVQRIVSRHGGRVWGEAAPGLGATIYFTLGRPTRS
ncbi:sensor histidine kinase [Caenimonas aquaedulcis]|uniref:histidine kinase n=1 Tax=Caenimonas aquaedulcis TaxID=2793270 RepID=A0A931H767_9BURK|nr:PAS domain S-box protein [Caenimonas aquaedulcis]MBG9389861.1 PAS domain S-box protein [Caenimonas aquaedulcis]